MLKHVVNQTLFQVCKEEEEAIKVDLHEGCGRTKLFWALLLADSCTLKAMVEFREGTRTSTKVPGVVSGVCRFCGTTGSSGLLAIGNVCAEQECQVNIIFTYLPSDEYSLKY